jgi:hypothetical protein
MSNDSDSKPRTGAPDEKPKLKVTDRRMFDTDGNPRRPDEGSTDAHRDAPVASETAAAREEETPEVAAASEAAAPTEDPSPTPSHGDSSSAPAAAPLDAAPIDGDTAPKATAEASEPAAASETDPGGGGSYADLPRGFAPFVESQYLEALIFLGAVPHPQTGETLEDHEFARYKIDLLTMIQEKTEGNLTEEEKRLIEDVLYQLRILFVQKTGPAAP